MYIDISRTRLHSTVALPRRCVRLVKLVSVDLDSVQANEIDLPITLDETATSDVKQ